MQQNIAIGKLVVITEKHFYRQKEDTGKHRVPTQSGPNHDTKRGRLSSAEIYSQLQERRNSAELECAAPCDLRARRHVVSIIMQNVRRESDVARVTCAAARPIRFCGTFLPENSTFFHLLALRLKCVSIERAG